MSVTAVGLALAVARAAGAEAPTPPPTPEEFTIYNVSPGISGFIAFFVLALVGWLLFRSLVRHMRKVDFAAAQRRRAEETAAAPEPVGAGEDTGPDGVARGTDDDRRGHAAE